MKAKTPPSAELKSDKRVDLASESLSDPHHVRWKLPVAPCHGRLMSALTYYRAMLILTSAKSMAVSLERSRRTTSHASSQHAYHQQPACCLQTAEVDVVSKLVPRDGG